MKTLKNKGITLIALVITIIVLLILAGVSIVTLTGDNGILTQAEDAKTKTTKAETREKIQLEMLASIGNDGKYDVKKAKQNLKDNLGLVENAENNGYAEDENGRLTIKYNGYDIYVDEKGKAGYEKLKPIFNPKTLTIGTPVPETTSKYGWKVTDYDVKTADCPSGVWRLFYQDSNYTYLINDELTAKEYTPSEHYSSYANGADVSTVGQKLSPKISSLFTELNTNPNIKFTAWMTDPEVWKDYKDKNGDAVFAIGSPTVELFAASYNNRSNKSYTIILSLGTYGYNDNTTINVVLDTSDNYGIYNKSRSTVWLLASPGGFGADGCLNVYGGYGTFGGYGTTSPLPVRPTVCIPTSVFDSKYADSLKDE